MIKRLFLIALCAVSLTAANPCAAATEPQHVQVTLNEWEIVMPDTLNEGPVVFHVANQGKLIHNFAVSGQGTMNTLSSELRPGQSGRLEMSLRKGEYRVYCPVNDHDRKGMQMTLRVK